MASDTSATQGGEASSVLPSVTGVATAIPAFIGYTAMATMHAAGDLMNKPTRIASMMEYERYFGAAPQETAIRVVFAEANGVATSASATLDASRRSPFLMWYALRLYFDNGGGPCYICSVGTYPAATAPVAGKLLGNESSTTQVGGLAAVGKLDEPTLLVFPEAQGLSAKDFLAVHHAALQQCADLRNRFVIMDVCGKAAKPDGTEDSSNDVNLDAATSDIARAASNFRSCCTDADNLEYGAAYAPNLQTVMPYAYDESKVTVSGLGGAYRTLAELKNGDPAATPKLPPCTVAYDMAVAAIARQVICTLPPAGAIAGIYAAVDNAHGVWKAPANVSVADVIQPTIAIDNAAQGGLNVDPIGGKSINAIRAFTGIGTLVWGARTLAGNDNDWRYVNVRRFCIFAEESIRRAMRQFASAPNDVDTWARVKSMIENFLTSLWRKGALMGVKPSDAFFVQVGLGTTMLALDVQEGRMIVVVGLCPLRPAEFIALRFVQTMPVS